ncbi:helix-turn-helix transcriptional regulator [Epilithonimonas ginsengisoli]|uniref:Helix-turn-helix transcriptional regulator n=1 Tax=Epilithonimonas ginsengisoli TaxID=1245592 RepID=A0ABU4JID8_9FLAO|nr:MULTISPECIES: helix-turn-helix transcriptional regulator [Chryseobacterium group]MBV6878828.1 helix-turn-helix transcriptional regulator [Epilithonimonas sp. FP105]MDW8549431.1 helix-turn-helix transcriptional regulator [Epilithonimonas ginsengisoli]OAH71687.1 XRE family transcriptional regulator [Chryseobacterium sp. FP211-J200]HBV17515.1 XRE family transcriptional regulator [Chryseobacterium carnipullorum]
MKDLTFTDAKKALGYRIFELRQKIINPDTGKPISQEELGLRTGLVKKTIGELERGNTNPEFETLLAIIRELNVTLQEFFNFDISEYAKLAELKK